MTFAPGLVRSIYHDRLPARAALIALSAFIAYELFAAGLVTIFLRRGRNYPVFGRYANALVETSFPTVLLFLLAGYLSAPPRIRHMAGASLFSLHHSLDSAAGFCAFGVYRRGRSGRTLRPRLNHPPPCWRTEDPTFSIGYHLTRSAVLLAAGLLAGSVGATIKSHFRRALAAASARDEVTNLFGQHVSPRVVEQLLAMGAAELSEMRRVCVMFVDIRSFTAAARSRTPAEVVERLDAVFEILVEAVDRHNGIESF